MADAKQKEIQEKVLVYQILQNQLEQFTKQATIIETSLSELEMTKGTLSEMKSVKQESDTLFHIGSGCYGHGKLLDQSKFLIEIGAGIMANKTLPEALSIMDARKKEIEKVRSSLHAEMEKVSNSMNQIGLELQKLNEDKPGGSGITVD